MQADQRRAHVRVPFIEDAILRLENETATCELHDISLKGALILAPAGPDLRVGAPCTLHIRLGDDNSSVIEIRGHIARSGEDHATPLAGIAFEDIDVDSMTHLRRLMELNLGDPALMERELSALLHD